MIRPRVSFLCAAAVLAAALALAHPGNPKAPLPARRSSWMSANANPQGPWLYVVGFNTSWQNAEGLAFKPAGVP